MRRLLVVMAESSVAERMKSELRPPLEERIAAQLHQCFLLDTLEKARSAPDAELVVAYSARDLPRVLREAAPVADGYIRIEERDTEPLESVFERLNDEDRSVVALDSDSPTLPAMCLELAFAVLDSREVDVVLGPREGGGCYLVGMRSHCPGLLEGFDWNASGAVGLVIERCAAHGLDWFLLPEWHAISRPADLAYLRGELLERSSSGDSGRHTRGFLKQLVNEGSI